VIFFQDEKMNRVISRSF